MKKTHLLVIFLVLLFSANSESAVEQIKRDIPKKRHVIINPSKIKLNMLRKAMEYYLNGNNNEAIKCYDQILGKDPGSIRALLGRGLVYRRKSDYSRAICDFTSAYNVSPHDEYGCALFNRGITYFFLEEYTKAEHDFSKRIELGCKELEIMNKVLLFFCKEFQGKNGYKILKEINIMKFNSEWPSPIVSFLLGSINYSTLINKTFSNDENKYKENLCEGYYYLGKYFLLHEDKTKAKEMFEKCIMTNALHYNEYDGAVIELSRIDN